MESRGMDSQVGMVVEMSSLETEETERRQWKHYLLLAEAKQKLAAR